MILPEYIKGLKDILNRHPRSSHNEALSKILSTRVNEIYGSVESLNQAIETALPSAETKPRFGKRLRLFHTSLPDELRVYMKREIRRTRSEQVSICFTPRSSPAPMDFPVPQVTIQLDPAPQTKSDRSSRCSVGSIKDSMKEETPAKPEKYNLTLFTTHKKQLEPGSTHLYDKVIYWLIKDYEAHYKAWEEAQEANCKQHHLIHLKILTDWATEQGYQTLVRSMVPSIQFMKNNCFDKVKLAEELESTPHDDKLSTDSEHSSLDDIFNTALDATLDAKENLLNWLGIVYERILASESLYAMSDTVKLINSSNQLKTAEDKLTFIQFLTLFESVFIRPDSSFEINIGAAFSDPLQASITRVQKAYQMNDDEAFNIEVSTLRSHLRLTYKELGMLLLNKSQFGEDYETMLTSMNLEEAAAYNAYYFQAFPAAIPTSSFGTMGALLFSQPRKVSESQGSSADSARSNAGTGSSKSSRRSGRTVIDPVDSTTDGNNESLRSMSEP